MIDLGKRSGVKQNMRFKVFKEGTAIKHPKTGAVLDVEKIQTGMAEITHVGEKTSKAKIIKETPGGAIGYGHDKPVYQKSG